MDFARLIKDSLPALPELKVTSLTAQLAGVAREVAAEEVAKVTARALLKGLDAVIAVAVKNLSDADAEELSAAYAEEVGAQLEQLAEATFAYIPLQLAVELAKERHGTHSPEATAARGTRSAGILALRAEVRDVFLAVAGRDPVD